MRLDQTRAHSAHWPTLILALKPGLLKRQVGGLVSVCVCTNVVSGNSGQVIPSIGTAVRLVTNRPGVGRCVGLIKRIAAQSEGGSVVDFNRKPIANAENNEPANRKRLKR